MCLGHHFLDTQLPEAVGNVALETTIGFVFDYKTKEDCLYAATEIYLDSIDECSDMEPALQISCVMSAKTALQINERRCERQFGSE